jgi:hypothetical protein
MKIWLSDKLKTFIVPTEMRDSSIFINGGYYSPGLRIQLKEVEYLRLFSAWGVPYETETPPTISKETDDYNIDIDLSSKFITEEDGELISEDIAYYNQGSDVAIHSGDFVCCLPFNPNIDNMITAEYIDIDIKKSRELFDYVIIVTNIFDSFKLNPSFNDMIIYSGLIELNGLTRTSNESINISNSLFKLQLRGKYQSHVPFIFDLKKNELIIVDKYSKVGVGSRMNCDSLTNMILKQKDFYFNALDSNGNMFDLINMYCEVKNYEIVSNISDCDIAITLEDIKDTSNYTVFNVSKNINEILDVFNDN